MHLGFELLKLTDRKFIIERSLSEFNQECSDGRLRVESQEGLDGRGLLGRKNASLAFTNTDSYVPIILLKITIYVRFPCWNLTILFLNMVNEFIWSYEFELVLVLLVLIQMLVTWWIIGTSTTWITWRRLSAHFSVWNCALSFNYYDEGAHQCYVKHCEWQLEYDLTASRDWAWHHVTLIRSRDF